VAVVVADTELHYLAVQVVVELQVITQVAAAQLGKVLLAVMVLH
jgi:hypothetical protein